MTRIANKFKELKIANKCAFIAYICAGDPDYKTSLTCLKNLANFGADIIEVGVPFLDPAGDGPIIEASAKRAIQAGMTLKTTLEMVREFRVDNKSTPIILMSYFNPILKYGIDKIFSDALKSGVDGFLIVDLPPEEENEILTEIKKNQLDLIHLIAPTTSIARAQNILKNASGFVYLISMLGITGTKLATIDDNKINLDKMRQITDLPIAIGFGIQDEVQAQQFAKIGFDGVVIGSTLVKEIAQNLNNHNLINKYSDKIIKFSNAIKTTNLN